jgi:5-formyltetrahydrofolate cyclo-ligase
MAVMKPTLRETSLRHRLEIPQEERARASRRIMEKFLSGVEIAPGSVVAGYWPVKGEVDVRPLLAELIRRGHSAALPQVTEQGRLLSFRAWHEGAAMVPGCYGIDEPDPESAAQVTPGVVIVPMLAFDARGHRLGYGGGFYDRTLPELNAFAIGVAYASQALEEVPAGRYDCRVDMVVTEEAIHRFAKQDA